VLLTVVLLMPFCGIAQEFAISNHKQNVFYIGVANPITIAVSKFDCRDIILKPSEGRVIAETPCNFIIIPTKPGILTLSLYEKKTNRLIGEQEYRARFLPEPAIYINAGGSNIRRSMLVDGDIQGHSLPGIDIGAPFKIQQYQITVFRNEKMLFREVVEGGVFNEAIKAQIKELVVGDIIVLDKIYGIGIDSVLRMVGPKEFKIVE